MPHPAPPHRKDPPQISDEQIARGTILRCSLGLDRSSQGSAPPTKTACCSHSTHRSRSSLTHSPPTITMTTSGRGGRRPNERQR